MSEAARLSKLLFESRELISMFRDIVENQYGQRDEWTRRVVTQIDDYRAERNWSPHGFGDEDMSDDDNKPATCQHCLADPAHTPVATCLPKDERCPVCGAAYTGSRRDKEYNALVEAGLVARGG